MSYTYARCSQGGDYITYSKTPEGGHKDNVYLFPTMLDRYQIQLTRLLEAEGYGEAKKLLRFLLQCQGEDKRHYDEWSNLLAWLEMAFPGGVDSDESGFGPLSQAKSAEGEDFGEEELRRQALAAVPPDDEYVEQVLYIMQHHPVADQQMLALERLTYLDHPSIDGAIMTWLAEGSLHPALQFKALQCLRKRGVTGRIVLRRVGEEVELEIERTPLSMDDFPGAVISVVERVELVTEVIDSTMPHFAREMWKECLQIMYGTSAYERLAKDENETVDCYSAALHMAVELSLYGRCEEDELRDIYGITDELRFRYEQAGRTLRQLSTLQAELEGDEP